jgi:hypothetical protein
MFQIKVLKIRELQAPFSADHLEVCNNTGFWEN